MPVFRGDGRPNPRAYGQISAGSVAGMWDLDVFFSFLEEGGGGRRGSGGGGRSGGNSYGDGVGKANELDGILSGK